MGAEDVNSIAGMLLKARKEGRQVPVPTTEPRGGDGFAYAVQDAVLKEIGPIGGWKVGAPSPEGPPLCSPLLRSDILPGPASLAAESFHTLGLEAEIAFRLGTDLPPRGREYTREEVTDAIAAVLPVIEVVDARWEKWPKIPGIWHLADLQANGALVTGAETADWRSVDLRRYPISLAVNGEVIVETVGGNKAGDLFRLVEWLANHAARRGRGLKRDDIVTTGSCTGLEFAAPGAAVKASFRDLGDVEVTFPAKG